MENVETIKTELGTTIKILHTGSSSKTIDKNIVVEILEDIAKNILSFTDTTLFSELTIEVWDPDRDDIPVNEYIIEKGKKKVVSYGIASYSGLTWASEKLIQINRDTHGQEPLQYFSDLISHEFGHWFAHKVDYKKGTFIEHAYNFYRGVDFDGTDTPVTEGFAEDFRILFGAYKTKDKERGNYKQATHNNELKELFIIMYELSKIVREKESKNLFEKLIEDVQNLKVIYDQNMHEAKAIFYKRSILFWKSSWYCIDKEGIFKMNSENSIGATETLKLF